MNDRWYLVEKFEEAENHYQVEEYITKAEFNKIFKEIKEYGRGGRVKSVSGSTDFIDKLNKSGYTLEGRKSGSSGYETQYGRKNNKVQRVDKKQVEGGERPASDRGRDSTSSSSNRQRVDLGTEQETSGKETAKVQNRVRSPFLKIVHTFTDLTGRKRNVLKFLSATPKNSTSFEVGTNGIWLCGVEFVQSVPLKF